MTKLPAILDVLILHEKELRSFLLRHLRCPQQAADLFQDLAEKALRRPPQQYGNPRAYLFQAASNALTDHWRSESCRSRHIEEALLHEELELDNVTPERQWQARETIALIEAALAELPPLTRQIFHLYRIEGVSQMDIASRLGISRSTVERRLDKAITHWQCRLAEAGDCDAIC
jgi:RNA polymerase sigma factor (sigma-70 family)